MSTVSLTDVQLLVPELILCGAVVMLFILDLVLSSAKPSAAKTKRLASAGLAVAALLASGWAAWLQSDLPATSAFSGQVAIDPMGTFFKLLFVAVSLVAVLTSVMSEELKDRHMAEYFGLLLSITFGLFLMASANDLLMVYLGIEVVSIVSFAMAGYKLHDRRSAEAAMKYVIYGGAASGMMLFGISMLYGLVGTTEVSGLNAAVVNWMGSYGSRSLLWLGAKQVPLILLISFVLIFAGVGYKISVVPFHMWAPDVYEGAPTPFTGFLSVGPKAAGFALLIRVFIGMFVPAASAGAAATSLRGFGSDLFGHMTVAPPDLPLAALLGIVAAVTMTLGNLAAIPQNNVKRLLAYSSIAHAGYILMGFVVLSEASLHAMLFYLVIYYLMNLGAFTVVQAVRDRTGSEQLHEFAGLGSREPWLAICMAIFMFSLVGLPPVAGFIAKFYIFAAVIERGGFWYVALAVVAVVNSVISLYYYMRIVRVMFLTEPTTKEPLNINGGYLGLASLLAIPSVILCFQWAPLSEAVHASIHLYRSPAAIRQAANMPAAKLPTPSAAMVAPFRLPTAIFPPQGLAPVAPMPAPAGATDPAAPGGPGLVPNPAPGAAPNAPGAPPTLVAPPSQVHVR